MPLNLTDSRKELVVWDVVPISSGATERKVATSDFLQSELFADNFSQTPAMTRFNH